MTPPFDAIRARAYLLGALDDRERDPVEDAYFASADALEVVEAAEEALIEDYLEDRLDAREHDLFARHYLASPEHRIRVEATRALVRGSRVAKLPARRLPSSRLMAIAATIAVIATGGVWMVHRSNRTSSPSGEISVATPASVPQPIAPATLAFSLAPTTARGVVETPALIIPPGIEVIALRLEGDGTTRAVVRGRVVISRVAGGEVWRGAITGGAPPDGVLAVVSVPARQLRPDDYLIGLVETDASGTEATRAQYFLRVREQ